MTLNQIKMTLNQIKMKVNQKKDNILKKVGMTVQVNKDLFVEIDDYCKRMQVKKAELLRSLLRRKMEEVRRLQANAEKE